MHLFDTHLHLDADEEYGDLFSAARAVGVRQFLVAGTTLPDSVHAAEVAAAETGVVAAAGIHPHEAGAFHDIGPFEELCAHPRVVAVGEIGLDYYYDHSPREAQREVFRAFLRLAAKQALPAIIHCRDAYEDCFEILHETLEPDQPFEIHSFTGTPEQAGRLLDMGALLSFNGMITFKRAENIRAAFEVVPLDRLLLETDSPYLAPVPYRGKRNQPAYLPQIATAVARLRGVSPEEVAAVTTANACRFFGLSHSDVRTGSVRLSPSAAKGYA
jgi:TatD DNase family protein